MRRNTLDVLAKVQAGLANGAYGMPDDVSRFLPDVANGDRLRRWVSMFGLTPKASEAATGVATVTGSNGITIESRTILVRADALRYVVVADTVIAGSVANVTIVAEGAGAGGALDTGQALTFLSAVAGIQAVATVAAPGIIGGVDEEDDDALRSPAAAADAQPRPGRVGQRLCRLGA